MSSKLVAPVPVLNTDITQVFRQTFSCRLPNLSNLLLLLQNLMLNQSLVMLAVNAELDFATTANVPNKNDPVILVFLQNVKIHRYIFQILRAPPSPN